MSYKYETHYNSPNYTPFAQVAAVFGIARQVKGFTDHWWGQPDTGMTYEGVISWLCRPGGNTSAHYVVDGPSRRVACIVSPQDASWAGGSALANATQVHIENNCNIAARMSTMDVSAELLADLRDPNAYGDQLLYGHDHWVPTQCPGHIDIDYIDQLSYKKQPGVNWGDVKDKEQPRPPVIDPPVVIPPVTQPPVQAEWVRNVVDIEDTKLVVLPAEGTAVYDLNTLQPLPNSIIPRGTMVDIAKKTTVGGQVFYISSYAATSLRAHGIPADKLGTLVKPPAQEKPEWLKNLQDIADKDMWTRSATPVLKLADGQTAEVLPVNKKVRVIKSTVVLGQPLLVLEGETTCIETIYLSDTPISNPADDLEKRVTAIEKLMRTIIEFLSGMFKNFKS